MAITITDPKLIEQIKAAGEDVVFTDGDGIVIARFGKQFPFAPTAEQMERCMTVEQLAASRAKGPGRPFRELLDEMHAKRACAK